MTTRSRTPRASRWRHWEFIRFINNDALTSLGGLESVEPVGYLDVRNNDRLASMAGLSGLRRVDETLAPKSLSRGSLLLQGMDEIVDFSGISRLEKVDGRFQIVDMGGLTSLGGLEGITSIGGGIEIRATKALTNLDALDPSARGSLERVQGEV